MTCQHVYYVMKPDAVKRTLAGREAFDPVYCTRPATRTFDRGNYTPYPSCNGPIEVCADHEQVEKMQRDLHIALKEGRI